MKALTLYQPYASAIALGFKQVETRGWRTHYRGPIAIHAAGVANLAYRPVFEKCAERAAFTAAGYRDFFNLPQGEIVAIAELVECEPVDTMEFSDRMFAPHESYWGDYRFGRFGWVLDNVRRLATPIRTRGMQGLWNWTPPADLTFAKPETGNLKPESPIPSGLKSPVSAFPTLPAYRLPPQIQRPPFAVAPAS